MVHGDDLRERILGAKRSKCFADTLTVEHSGCVLCIGVTVISSGHWYVDEVKPLVGDKKRILWMLDLDSHRSAVGDNACLHDTRDDELKDGFGRRRSNISLYEVLGCVRGATIDFGCFAQAEESPDNCAYGKDCEDDEDEERDSRGALGEDHGKDDADNSDKNENWRAGDSLRPRAR